MRSFQKAVPTNLPDGVMLAGIVSGMGRKTPGKSIAGVGNGGLQMEAIEGRLFCPSPRSRRMRIPVRVDGHPIWLFLTHEVVEGPTRAGRLGARGLFQSQGQPVGAGGDRRPWLAKHVWDLVWAAVQRRAVSRNQSSRSQCPGEKAWYKMLVCLMHVRV